MIRKIVAHLSPSMKARLKDSPLAQAVGRRMLAREVVDFREQGRVFSVRMDMTNICNLQCKMCPWPALAKSGKVRREDMPLELFQRIAEQVFPYTRNLQLGCEFEATLHPNLPEMLRIAMDSGVTQSGMITNGTRLTPQLCEAIAQSDLTSVGISIDGPDAESFESIRIGAKFDQVIQRAKRYVETLQRQERPGPRLKINHVLMCSTLDRLDDFARLCIDIGASEIEFLHCAPRTRENAEYAGNRPEAYNAARERTVLLLDAAGVRYDIPDPFDLDDETGRYEVRDVNREICGQCQAPWRLMQINSRGQVFPCSPRTVKPPFGDFRRETFDEIWNNLQYLQLRYELRTGQPSGPCVGCRSFSTGKALEEF
ncbi:radical SAM protein [Candidatus Sumerlaeota bacterium]|nr:radical SAM protein [Candidatus Sumerlaeota bacterium]